MAIDLSVLVPCYNEILTIRAVLDRVAAVPIDKEIVVVDDGSTDGTRAVLARVEAEWKRAKPPRTELRVFFQPANRGKGAAIRRAIAEAQGRVCIVQDADLEYDPAECPKLVDPILNGQADVVYGSRFAGHPRRVLYFWHSVGNRVLTLISNMLTDLDLTDMETCYKAFRSDIVKSLPLREDRFGFEPEVTALIAGLGLRIYEVPISYAGRTYAEGKKIGWRDGVEALKVMIRANAARSRDESSLRQRAVEVTHRTGKYNDWVFSQLEPYVGRRVLEIGSGFGNLTVKLLNRDYVVATDADERNVAQIRARLSRVDHAKVERIEPAEPLPKSLRGANFDTVLCCNVLERADDDDAVLRTCRAALPVGGTLVLLTSAHPAAYGSLDERLGLKRRYTRPTIERKLELAGFAATHVFHMNALAALGWVYRGKLRGRSRITRRDAKLFDYLVPYLNKERALRLPFGLSMAVIATAVPSVKETSDLTAVAGSRLHDHDLN